MKLILVDEARPFQAGRHWLAAGGMLQGLAIEIYPLRPGTSSSDPQTIPLCKWFSLP